MFRSPLCSGSFYPGTGAAHEVGEGAGEGYSVNVPWPCGGMRNADYLAAFNHVVLPIAYGECTGWAMHSRRTANAQPDVRVALRQKRAGFNEAPKPQLSVRACCEP